MKRKPKVTIFLIYCIVMSFFLAACTPPTEPSQEIIFGAAWPFTTDDTGQFEKGIDLACSQINAAGGIHGRKLEIIKEDDNAQIVGGLAAAKRLSDNSSVLAVIGHLNSFVSIPASAVYEQAGLVMLSPASTSSKLTQNGNAYTFRNLPSDDEIAKELVEYASGSGLGKMVIFYSDDSYGVGLAESLEDQAKLNNISIVDRFSFYTSQAELRRLFDRWQAFDFDGIFISSTTAQGIEFIIQAKKIGIDVPFLSGNSLDSSALMQLGGAFSEGTIVCSVFDPSNSKKEVQSFVESFQNVYGQAPEARAALAYDAVWMLADAAKKAGDLSRASIAEQLRNLGEWTGVCGTHLLSPAGDDLGDLAMIKVVRDGVFAVPDK